MLSRLIRMTCFTVPLFAFSGYAHSQTAQFDLSGPTLEVKVQRAGKSLPIAQVPTLNEGDRLWLHPVLGEHESVHYLMVAVFLRGSTNPPPDNWFVKVEAWNKQVIEEGAYIVVPPGAQQAVVLFAPETGGDFSTLKSAVRGRPGAFVRASQDLSIASEDRDRINTYLASLKDIQDPEEVKSESNTLARSLSLKLNGDCFSRPADQQAICLQQSQSAIVLDNGSSSATQGLLNGPSSDLALQAGSTVGSTAGLYDPYIAVALDIGRLLATFHTAQYQYIPALSSADGGNMNLWLNAPPSFHNPKSVLVVALPSIKKAEAPRLHPVDPKQIFCMGRSPLVLPVDGEPAIFSTGFAHGLTLHLQSGNGQSVDLPTHPDAAKGGFLVPAPVLENVNLGMEVEATVQGYWGFDPYKGPSFKLRSAQSTSWTLADADKNALVVGRDDELHLRSPSAACVDEVDYRDASGKNGKAPFKLDGVEGIVATIPLKGAQAGPVLLSIKQSGLSAPQTLNVSSFAEAGNYSVFTFHAGDKSGVLSGTRLDQVAGLDLHGERFAPGKLSRTGGADSLELTAADTGDNSRVNLASLAAGSSSTAQLTLKDGRSVPVSVTVNTARPLITLLNKNVQLAPAPQPAPPVIMRLGAPDELPPDGKLTFSVKSQIPETFSKGESLEIATVDGLSSTTFSLASGQLVLQDAKTAIGVLDPAKSFSPSAFGPLHMRPILADGTTGDWVPVATLVRLPSFTGYNCPPNTGADTPTSTAPGPNPGPGPCTLTGEGLYLLQSVSAESQFLNPVTIPDGFAASILEVPRPSSGQLFARLRDDPAVVNIVSIDRIERTDAPNARATSRHLHHPLPTPDASIPNAPAASAVSAVPASEKPVP